MRCSVSRYEREEIFFALSVTVKNETLQDSLDQYVKGERLDGDNAYFCEKCGEKVTISMSLVLFQLKQGKFKLQKTFYFFAIVRLQNSFSVNRDET